MINYNGQELWTYFFNKPKRYYNKYMFEMVEYPNYLIFSGEEIKNLKGNWNNVFQNENGIYLEIGSGSGNFTIEMATKHKDKNFIGDELRLKRLVYSAKKSEKRDLKNIKFIRYDATHLNEFIAHDELSGLFINFPDPWEGEEHKRILSESLLNTLRPLLKDNSKIYFKTDHLDYYNSVLELIKKTDNYKVIYHTDDLHNTDYKPENIRTEFENLFINKLKISIKYIEILKCKE
ncbi:tRNA (guanosine(46)-N7)-methyltransferase TrmB [Caviibacter abscessus]|uniref:tRNA (guanosine(46)-N7)-methyltransferase TrmB n=1 Tax=Caviibacter abscessus TaxID=1766719 RepID=UPI00082FFED3|nr:tRNA (guanosine(46)-N7)-methyltransferase TrmB [Caviibacter abscessus]